MDETPPPVLQGSEATGPCPVCGRLAVARFRPFCSRRCADIDLGRWFTQGYVIPGPAAGLDEDPPGEG